METVDVVPYAHEYDDQIVTLQSMQWGRSADEQRAYFRWKYDQNPCGSDRLLFLALVRGRVVGMRGYVPAEWYVGERRVAVACGGDLVVAPEYRGQKLPVRIFRLASKDLVALGYEYLLGFSGVPATYIHAMRTGWRDIGALPTVRRRYPGARFLLGVGHRAVLWSRRMSKLSMPLGLSGLSTKRQDQILSCLDARIAMDGIHVDVAPRPEAMASFVANLPRNGQVWQKRDAGYFAWRFLNPLRCYRFVYLGDPLAGYAVVGANRFGGHIVELEATNMDGRRALLDFIVSRGRFWELQCWAPTRPGPEADLLAGQRFLPIAQKPSDKRYRPALLVKELADTEPLPRIVDWELRMACSDAF